MHREESVHGASYAKQGEAGAIEFETKWANNEHAADCLRNIIFTYFNKISSCVMHHFK